MQQQMEDIELQIWEYLDNACSEAEKQRVEQLISSNEVWRKKFAELKALQSELQELEEHHPSMRFTANVMDSIATAHVASTTVRYLNNWVIKGIAAFFLVLIGAAIIFSVVAINAPNAHVSNACGFNKYFNSDVLTAVMFINILLALAVLDRVLRRRQEQKHLV
ncbi:anti-sigma factor family protein [Polluticoccus soli]|uniref:anti-sigma factor family protein n=1 Tax=Polluticoccus soli TaxID=3034150 RepID=UPI0023E34477|nr:hypothetical protein [Flavipsychrobacter sp. JY13-12]